VSLNSHKARQAAQASQRPECHELMLAHEQAKIISASRPSYPGLPKSVENQFVGWPPPALNWLRSAGPVAARELPPPRLLRQGLALQAQ